MPKFALSKSIEARRLNRSSGVPTTDPLVTIPYGGIVENLTEDRDLVRFSYLGEPYQCPRDVLDGAVTSVQSPGAKPSTTEVQREADGPAAMSDPALKWEQVTSNHNKEVIRAKVPGGWLVAVGGAGLTFYPDPAHNWDPGSNSPGA